MSEITEADEAVQARQESISESIADATGLEPLDVYRRLFVGMDLDAKDVLELSHEHAEAGCVLALEMMENREDVSLNDFLSSAWMDGFSVGCMVFLRRAGR
jgi:hypothetical protein